jgi:hypothetical protein
MSAIKAPYLFRKKICLGAMKGEGELRIRIYEVIQHGNVISDCLDRERSLHLYYLTTE